MWFTDIAPNQGPSQTCSRSSSICRTLKACAAFYTAYLLPQLSQKQLQQTTRSTDLFIPSVILYEGEHSPLIKKEWLQPIKNFFSDYNCRRQHVREGNTNTVLNASPQNNIFFDTLSPCTRARVRFCNGFCNHIPGMLEKWEFHTPGSLSLQLLSHGKNIRRSIQLTSHGESN